MTSLAHTKVSTTGEQTRSSLISAIEASLDEGDVGKAFELCEAAITREIANSEAYRCKGLLLAASANFKAAIASGKHACELAPDDPRAWSDLGRIYALSDSLDEAILCFNEALTIDARHVDAWHNLGTALTKQRQHEAAFTALKNALLLDPARADTYLALGNLLAEAEQLADALECFERAARHNPGLAVARSRLAAQLSAHGKVERAESLFRQSLSLDNDHIEGWLGLGRTLEDIGDAERALSCYRNVLARRSDHAAALGSYLALLRKAAPDGLLDMAQHALVNPVIADANKALIGYGLAKFYDRQKDFAAAAAAGRAANAARRRATSPLDRESLQARADALVARYDEEFFAQRRAWGIGTDQPVFIVGLPRSGTTLTEQIIASHPLLHGAGELPDLAQLATRIGADNNVAPWRAAEQLGKQQSRESAYTYLRALRDGASKQRLRISDKSPFNFFQLAFAALLFPNARVIHCRRDARDTALSIWMENFNAKQHYSTDFGDLAFIHACHDRIMAHWHQVLPLRILDVEYESTVTDVEAQARSIIDFLEVPWDHRCLDFHQSKRAVQTPSRWQVREKVYSRSVGRWHSYAPHLPELVAAFAARDAQS